MTDKDNVMKEVLSILQIEFNKDTKGSNLQNENLFGEKIGIMPRDYLNLIDLIEKKYLIKISGSDIEKYELKTANQLVDLIFIREIREEIEKSIMIGF